MTAARWIAPLALLLGCVAPGRPAAAGDEPHAAPAGADSRASAPKSVERPVDLVLCLDTSNSMDGLIDAAKRHLWDVVNDLSRAKPIPHLRVALLSYGNNGYPKEEGWVVTDSPFTEDLDFISEKLFALRTFGGEEYVGRVLDTALDRLKWSDDGKALRIVVVAGNESADQDRKAAVADVCTKAAKRGVIVNAIYCGAENDSIAPGWRDVAKRAEGEFAAIDADRRAPVCVTPYDTLLAKLSESINATYIPFGVQGAAGCSNQRAQDANNGGLGLSSAASRGQTKGSSNYRASHWDLVDAIRYRDLELAAVATADLPACMQKMTLDERTKYVDEMAAKRAEIRKEITDLGLKRDAFLADAAAKAGAAAESTLAHAVRRAVRAQAERKGFTFEAK